jgi:hypothetical protein
MDPDPLGEFPLGYAKHIPACPEQDHILQTDFAFSWGLDQFWARH